MHIVIDGYNLIFAVPELEKILDRENMEMARESFLTVLSRYKSESRQEFTVVFDARGSGEEGPGYSQKQLREGISIIFSRCATADEDIMDLIHSSSNPRNICIVTSDKVILRAARSSGCRATRPRDFYKRITKSSKKMRTPPGGGPGVKYRGLSEEEVDYWIKVFRAKPDKGP